MGLTFLLDTVYLLPLTIVFLGVSVGALGIHANNRRGYGPFVLGLFSGIILLVGKFFVESDIAMYASLVGLIVASVWNAWPKPKRDAPSAPTETFLQLGSIKRRDVHGNEAQD